ncbi:hypothetical protein PHYPSEUDO_012429 [Phytophthora pseudosyringae]|uniref:Uncharacterized protein n=1 Tax=Phytophthora pseudosyringae TaxID=221518 RepID=A0A8T1WM81_9STRA|nr:hypothetical protein PHYPSEUDO_012429 [Phytophthora pseudosyringae]
MLMLSRFIHSVPHQAQGFEKQRSAITNSKQHDKAWKGRGVENYSPEDVEALLEFTGNVLPTGANEWGLRANPLSSVSLLSQLLVLWFKPLVSLGVRCPLSAADL